MLQKCFKLWKYYLSPFCHVVFLAKKVEDHCSLKSQSYLFSRGKTKFAFFPRKKTKLSFFFSPPKSLSPPYFFISKLKILVDIKINNELWLFPYRIVSDTSPKLGLLGSSLKEFLWFDSLIWTFLNFVFRFKSRGTDLASGTGGIMVYISGGVIPLVFGNTGVSFIWNYCSGVEFFIIFWWVFYVFSLCGNVIQKTPWS